MTDNPDVSHNSSLITGNGHPQERSAAIFFYLDIYRMKQIFHTILVIFKFLSLTIWLLLEKYDKINIEIRFRIRRVKSSPVKYDVKKNIYGDSDVTLPARPSAMATDNKCLRKSNLSDGESLHLAKLYMEESHAL